MVETMRWEGERLLLLDQTKLPHAQEFIICDNYLRVSEAIKRLEVRGAPAIGAAAAFGMVLAAREAASEADFLAVLSTMKDELVNARPTAVNLAWAVNKLFNTAVERTTQGILPNAIVDELQLMAQAIYENDIAVNKRIGMYGAAVLPERAVVLTHCNAGALATCGWGTALGVVREAWRQGKLEMVYSDETRPLLQGARLTVFELCEDDIPVTLITDGMAAWTMKTRGINCVIVGADRIAANGDTANKIGTYGVGLAAQAHNIPFYVAAPTSTFDFTMQTGDEIPIEERGNEEVKCCLGKKIAPDRTAVFNPAFDVTSHELIAGIITEYGVIKAPYAENIAKLKALTELE